MSSLARTDTIYGARDFGYGSDEALLHDQARKLLTEYAGSAALRRLLNDHEAVYARGELPPYDAALFAKCVELGWTALAVPEDCGGIGAKQVAVLALVEEVGRHAFASPLLPTLISSLVLRESAAQGARDWLRRIAEGTTLSLALGNHVGAWELDATEVSAVRSAQGVVLNGVACCVQDAFKVDSFLVTARASDELYLVALKKDAAGLQIERDHIFDLTRDQAHLVLQDVKVAEADVIAAPATALSVLKRAWPAVLTVVSADLIGASEWQLQTTVEYAKARTQFEHTIGFFQAVKHPLVDAMLAIDRARSHLYNAASVIDLDPTRAEIPARMAKSAASDAATFMSSRSVQLHGGIGFTWECDVHVYFKRNQHNAALYGDGVHQRRKLAALLLDDALMT